MAFSVVENEIRKIWCATDGASTYYVGQLVTCSGATAAYIDGTVAPLPTPSGEADLTDDQVVFGVVTGTNNETPTYGVNNPDTTFALQTITGVATQAAQIARISTGFFGQEGMYSKGDPQPLVEVAVVGPNTVLKGDIFNGAHGTACATSTADAAASAGWVTGTAGSVAAGCPFTPADMMATWYCRSGANAGLYRTADALSATAPELAVPWPYAVAVGDVFVAVPMKQGFSMPYIGGPGLYFDQGTAAITNSFEVIVLELNLEESGKEHAIFCFTSTHFGQSRNE